MDLISKIYEREKRKLMFLVGEGDFSFSKVITDHANYDDYDIIATEYRLIFQNLLIFIHTNILHCVFKKLKEHR
jgi:hypothetical protein